jgi:hypothetical protein
MYILTKILILSSNFDLIHAYDEIFLLKDTFRFKCDFGPPEFFLTCKFRPSRMVLYIQNGYIFRV